MRQRTYRNMISLRSTALNTSKSCGSFHPDGLGAGELKLEVFRVIVERILLAQDSRRFVTLGDDGASSSPGESGGDGDASWSPESDIDIEGLVLIWRIISTGPLCTPSRSMNDVFGSLLGRHGSDRTRLLMGIGGLSVSWPRIPLIRGSLLYIALLK